MHALSKKRGLGKTLGVMLLGAALSACDTTATQGLLPQIVQGAMAPTNGTAGAPPATNTTNDALAQVAASMIPGTNQQQPTTSNAQPASALSGSSEVSFFSKSGLQACGGGALASVLTCKLTNTCDSSKGAIQAAVLGCGIGIGANYYLDYQRGQYADAEQRLDVLIADVRADNQKLQTLTSQAQQVLKQDKQTLAQIQNGIKRKSMEKSAAQTQLAKVDANTQTLNKTLADLKGRQQQWQDVANKERGQSPKVQALDAEIGRMQKQIVTLEREVDSVEQQRAGLALG